MQNLINIEALNFKLNMRAFIKEDRSAGNAFTAGSSLIRDFQKRLLKQERRRKARRERLASLNQQRKEEWINQASLNDDFVKSKIHR